MSKEWLKLELYTKLFSTQVGYIKSYKTNEKPPARGIVMVM